MVKEITLTDLVRIEKIKRTNQKIIITVLSTGSAGPAPVHGPSMLFQNKANKAAWAGSTIREYIIRQETDCLHEGDILELEYLSKLFGYEVVSYKVIDHAAE